MKTKERSVLVEMIARKWEKLQGTLDERVARHWAAAEADAIGYGGIAIVAEATGFSRRRIGVGRRELRVEDKPTDIVNVRRRGAGRKKAEVVCPEILRDLDELVNPATRGDPESPLLWTSKSLRSLAKEIIERRDIWICPQVVGRLLKQAGYSLQAPSKTMEGKRHPDREAQFEKINATAVDCMKRGVPIVSVDTKKKELVGNFKNNGREWQRKGAPDLTDIHDFPHQAIAKAVPYGVYDVAANCGFVNVGIDHDTGAFAVASIETWWRRMGSKRYPNATDLYITPDAGGSNGYRLRQWKQELQRLANVLGMSIHVNHFPPGTSKWNAIEHRLFSFISMNWRGKPLRTLETVVGHISNTRTSTGLVVEAVLDESKYPLGRKVSDREMDDINITKDDFHGEWNYTIRPNFESKRWTTNI